LISQRPFIPLLTRNFFINYELLRILSNFLQDCTQRVVLPNGTSTFCSVISGVPQGSVIGPVLFLVYINDIVDLFENTNVCTKLYVDDIKIYLDIACDTDHTTLQDSINKIYTWSKTWQLKLASNKCQHNRITLSTDASRSDDYSLSDVLPTVNNVRDLGVLVDSRLTFHDHISNFVWFCDYLMSL